MIAGGATTVPLSLATLGRNRQAIARGRWGDLIDDPDGIIDLPAGFSYQIIETRGDSCLPDDINEPFVGTLHALKIVGE